MKFSRRGLIKLAVMSVFLCCMLFANFIAVRLILGYGVDAYFYDKLLVAYNIGGREGLKTELGKITVTDKLAREAMLAKDLNLRLENLADPGVFLGDKVRDAKGMVSRIRGLRTWAIYVMLVLFGWQLAVNMANKNKPGRPV